MGGPNVDQKVAVAVAALAVFVQVLFPPFTNGTYRAIWNSPAEVAASAVRPLSRFALARGGGTPTLDMDQLAIQLLITVAIGVAAFYWLGRRDVA